MTNGPISTEVATSAVPETGRERSRSPRGQRETNAAFLKMKALLLGLERRPDRRQRCEAMLKKEVPWLDFEFFRATDGKIDEIPDEAVAKTWNTKANANYGDYEDVVDDDGKVIHTKEEFSDPGVDYAFSPGERGCAHSHYRMWERAAAASGPTLILEDDLDLCFPRPDGTPMNGEIFTNRLAEAMQECTAANADVLYLSWSGNVAGNYKHLTEPAELSSVIRRVEYVWTTVAYVIWPAGAKKLLEQSKPLNQPVDNFMAWEAREGRLESYAVLDVLDVVDEDNGVGGIASQLDFQNDSDIKKSDGGDQGDDPKEFLVRN